MSVVALINHPQTEEERRFNIPVMTEAVCRIVGPVAERLGLDLCDNWGTFNEVGPGQAPEFFRQLDCLAVAVADQEPGLRDYIEHRFSNLKERMAEAVERRADVEFYVG
ncbi:hypothetical protein J5226_15710 [Lysobacter sp. K5869]|uniref:hypothetical protein n=1 Tax=Lysobacter sp. K5869 TaxID=2820808 RepID=UPI001C0603B4|nr:hypothetical protein [Lysobacter sp. K5869]QWP75078.1 hypothetical protein J5226_15710 [Lysobacter sp. K5869]